MAGFLSTSIFTIFALSPTFNFRSSKMGFIILQGPHHSAEKSTKTGVSLFINSENESLGISQLVGCVTDAKAICGIIVTFDVIEFEIKQAASALESTRSARSR